MPNKMPPKTVARVKRLHEEGVGRKAIARRVGIAVSTVRRILGCELPQGPRTTGVADAVNCDPWWCDKCKVLVTTDPCIACRTREWVANRKK